MSMAISGGHGVTLQNRSGGCLGAFDVVKRMVRRLVVMFASFALAFGAVFRREDDAMVEKAYALLEVAASARVTDATLMVVFNAIECFAICLNVMQSNAMNLMLRKARRAFCCPNF